MSQYKTDRREPREAKKASIEGLTLSKGVRKITQCQSSVIAASQFESKHVTALQMDEHVEGATRLLWGYENIMTGRLACCDGSSSIVHVGCILMYLWFAITKCL